jgi:hypothetical protein
VRPAGKNIMVLLSDQAGLPQARNQCGNRASTHWPRCFLAMLLKWSGSSRITSTIRVSSTQWTTYIRITRNLFPLPASNTTLVHLLILWKESKHFPQQNTHAKCFSVYYVIWAAISRTKSRTLWSPICWWSK